MNILFKKTIGIGILCAFLITSSASFSYSGLRERLQERREQRENAAASSDCDTLIPEIKQDYGANGPYDIDVRTIRNPLWNGEPITVLLPKGSGGPRPVIFFSHGFGAEDWKQSYTHFLRHMVSRGYIVVYSPYQTFRATMDERYATLWKGFELAAQQFGAQMDLTRIGFVGHSFGGGATPAMAYKGLVKAGWGKKAAFLYIMAPWYSFQISTDEMRQFPEHITLVLQVYDKDDTNDHRMAMDLFYNIRLSANQKHFQIVQSKKINECELVADHATPNRNASLRLKQYAVFRTFDALADSVFQDNSEGNRFIANTNVMSSNDGYQPLLTDAKPKPVISEKSYRFPWDSDKNPRRASSMW